MDPTVKVNDNALEKQEIIFENNKNKAFMIKTSANESAENIINTLELSIKPESAILLFGGASRSLDISSTSVSILYQILDNILQYAFDNNAIIIDGGTKSGIMEIVGQRASELEQSKKPVLLGVAPADLVSLSKSTRQVDDDDDDEDEKYKVSLDPNHSHFVLVDGKRWGDETAKLFEIAMAFANYDIPVVAFLAGGGEISKKEMLFCVKQSWPIIVIKKTGYLADEIAYYKSQSQTPQDRSNSRIQKFIRVKLLQKAYTKAYQNISDVKLKKIISFPSLIIYPSDLDQQKSFEHFLLLTLNFDPLLESAWQNMAIYDESAKRLQNNFNRFQKFILGIGVLATLLAIINTQFKVSSPDNFVYIINYVLVALPITISILIAALNRFRFGAKWVLLRAASEAIKSEIYHYRTRAFLYNQKEDTDEIDQITTTITPKEKLSNRISYINSSLMKTDVSLHGLYKYDGPLPPKMYGAAEDDDGYSALSAEQYIKIRIDDQLSYYQNATYNLEKQLKTLQWLILLSGGTGTFLAAAGFQIWIALTTTLVATFVSFLEYKQIENTLIKYNQTKTELSNIKLWWMSLSTTERTKKGIKDKLVQKTEDVLRTELSGWIRQMQVTIDKLYTKKEAMDEKNLNK
jgi:TRPM family ion channel/conflict system pore-forming effector with SLATT domain/uncharacterized protein DUF4231